MRRESVPLVRLLAAAALPIALCGMPDPVAAQTLRVHAVDATTAQPVAGALVDVRDAGDDAVWQGVLSSDGRRVVPLARPGTYRVRLRRIGYEPVVSPPYDVATGDTVDVAIQASSRRVVLGTVVVTARRCARDAFADESFATLWEEVRKALTATVLSRGDDALLLEARAFRRVLDDDRRVQEEYVGLPRVTDAERPYVARSAAELSRDGYVRNESDGTEFFAPDEHVLLSDEFLADHCFEVTRGHDATAGLLGVGFTPAGRRRTGEIAGTMWLDSATAELRHLDFWYVHETLPRPALGEDRSGGQVVFERLASGQWIVGAWRLRMPRFDQGRRLSRDSRVDGYAEFGGVIGAAGDTTGSVTPALPVLAPYHALLEPARIAGTVYDSLAGRPLAGARVWLVPFERAEDVAAGLAPTGGTLGVEPVTDTADAAGRFAFDAIPAGTYRLGFEHAALDSLGVLPTRHEIRLRPGANVAGDLTVPSLATLAAGCTLPAGTPPDELGGMIFGVVRSAADGRPLENALVRVAWVDVRRFSPGREAATNVAAETRTDSTGFYRVCGVPDSTIAAVQAAGPRSSTGEVSAQVGPLGVARVNLQLAEVEEGAAAPPPGTLVGTVTDTLGRPLADARVTIDGSAHDARTDEAGRFRLSDVAAGTQTVEVRRIGRDPARRTVDVRPGDTTSVSLTLAGVQLLETLVVRDARRPLSPQVADAVRRHRAGAGHLLTGERLRSRATIQSVLHELPGVQIANRGATWVAMMRRHGMAGGDCEARAFVDGIEVDYDEVLALDPDRLAAIEVFVRPAQAPLFTTLRSRFDREDGCGVVVFWTAAQ